MTTALIGSTGFVGGQLARQAPFASHYRSTDIDGIRGRRLELLVCAGVRAEKWRANADPVGDQAGIARLTEALADVRAERVVLVSTVDVFARPVGVDEATPAPADAADHHAYGRHRRQLELWFAARVGSAFGRLLIVRLPGLFGDGLKKNVIYDLLHDNQLDRVHADAEFQFYGLDRLWSDIGVAEAAGLSLVHLTAEPVSVAEVAHVGFGREFANRPAGAVPARYDFRTRHADLWGRAEPYQISRAETLRAIAGFVAAQRATAREN